MVAELVEGAGTEDNPARVDHERGLARNHGVRTRHRPSVFRGARSFARFSAGFDHGVLERLIDAKPFIANSGGRAVLLERLSQEMMSAIEMPGQNRESRVCVR